MKLIELTSTPKEEIKLKIVYELFDKKIKAVIEHKYNQISLALVEGPNSKIIGRYNDKSDNWYGILSYIQEKEEEFFEFRNTTGDKLSLFEEDIMKLYRLNYSFNFFRSGDEPYYEIIIWDDATSKNDDIKLSRRYGVGLSNQFFNRFDYDLMVRDLFIRQIELYSNKLQEKETN